MVLELVIKSTGCHKKCSCLPFKKYQQSVASHPSKFPKNSNFLTLLDVISKINSLKMLVGLTMKLTIGLEMCLVAA